MPLYVKDAEVDRLAGRVAAMYRISKTEAVRRALLHELERGDPGPSVERTMAFVRALHERIGPERGPPADKAFIDSLYERD
jgi:antitoxin VapB